LEEEYSSKINIESIKDEDITGNFEITLLETNQLIHSKKVQELGKCNTVDERNRLKSIIDVYLNFIKNKKLKSN
jgi:hypothetical protein